MQVRVKGVHVPVSDAWRERLEEKLAGPLRRLVHNPAAELEVHLVDSNGPKGGEDKELRVTLHLPGAKSIHVEQAAVDAYTALDLVKDRLERAVKRELERMREPGRGPPVEAFGTGE